MLGWFRKKKKTKEPVPEEQQEYSEEIAAGADEEAAGPVSDDDKGDAREPEVESETAGDAVDEARPPEVETEIPGDFVDEARPPEVEAKAAGNAPPARPEKNKSLFARLQAGLSKTRTTLVYRLDTFFLGKKEIDQELFDDLEEILITADLGVGTVQDLLDEVRIEVKRSDLKDPRKLKGVLSDKIRGYLLEQERTAELIMPESGPLVIMVVGVNGVGKTTSIGKIAAKFVNAGSSVLLVAGDTFRAAAIDQLKIWGDRCGVEVVAQKPGSDPSSVVFDAIELGTARNYDVIIVDTAGRLHTQVNLMEELKKIKRVIGKKLEGAPHEVMLVLDATTGQNGISQARMFNEAVGVTGLTLTKLDGTAKGGIVVNICRQLNIPVRFIGVGEQVDDLREFDANEFIDALFKQSSDEASGN
ncbi:MAG: signal recognition particle-docking protein FtsY [Desulfobulbaceae bacterium]|nr:signal recognition particle-docking protein FtsY [Desulfobulbaceae bacterium]